MNYRTPEMPSCRYLDPSRGKRRLPYVYFDPLTQLELPCEGLVNDEIMGYTEGVAPENATALVPLKGFLNQRAIELCPRGLPKVVPQELRP